ncbi:MAG: hypothetical protein BWY17_00795 [Deltaproteobacteria bacterium ADurb.Bin207]|nr:MAG: hypothetical protein BWY17_00795 [Deltaproteobacteria bacterium ADurb.Bin207]
MAEWEWFDGVPSPIDRVELGGWYSENGDYFFAVRAYVS